MAEKILWQSLRNRNVRGKKFLRQHPVFVEFDGRETFFVADFYCAEEKLVIELDGKIHEFQVDQDRMRDEILSVLGYRIVHMKNEEVVADLEGALRKIDGLLN